MNATQQHMGATRHFLFSGFLVACLLGVQGCVVHEDVGSVLGAGVGATLGSIVGGGSGQGAVLTTVMGGVLGGKIGQALGRRLDEKDKKIAAQALKQSLDSGEAVEWRSPHNQDVGGVIRPLQQTRHHPNDHRRTVVPRGNQPRYSVDSQEEMEWHSSRNQGVTGVIRPLKTRGQCREYSHTVIIGGKKQQVYGKACLQTDGSWKIIQ